MSIETPYSVEVTKDETSKAIHVLITGKNSNHNTPDGLRSAVLSEFSSEEVEDETIALSGDGFLVGFKKIVNGVVVGYNYKTIHADFVLSPEEVARILARMAYIQFEEGPVTVDTNDQYTLLQLLKNLNAQKTKVIALDAFQEKLFAELLIHEPALKEIISTDTNSDNKPYSREKTHASIETPVLEAKTIPPAADLPLPSAPPAFSSHLSSGLFGLKMVEPTAPPVDMNKPNPVLPNNRVLPNDRLLPNDAAALRQRATESLNDKKTRLHQMMMEHASAQFKSNHSNQSSAAPAA